MVYKPRGRKFYLVEFRFRGKRILKRTKVTHVEDARAIESAIRTELERGNYGILKPKPSLTLAQFLRDEFLPYTEARFRQAKPNTAIYYQYGAKMLLASPLAALKIDAITGREAGQFIACNAHRRPSTTNKGLETLRRALNLAYEWGRLGRKPRIALAKGARQRTRVLSQEEAQDYLAACAQPWRDVATLILGTGMRPGECCALRWEHVLLGEEGGLIQIAEGKSKAARRILPMVPDVLTAMRARHNAQGCPTEGWVFPSRSMSGHLGRFSYGKKHRRALEMIAKAHEMMPSLPAVVPFEPYCLRHTALTRLAPHADAYTLAQIAGHGSIAMTMRYVHPQAEAVEKAFKGMAGLPTTEPTKAGGKR
jgi:integrase